MKTNPPLGPFPNISRGGIVQVNMVMQFLNNTPYPNPWRNQGSQSFEYYEVCRSYGHNIRLCPILKTYFLVPNLVYWKFYGTSTHSIYNYRYLDAPVDILDKHSFKASNSLYPQGTN